MYCIFNKVRNLFCRWDEKVIIFDSKEQIIEFMNIVPAFFIGEHNNVRIFPINEDMEYDMNHDRESVIHYNDLRKEDLIKTNQLILNKQNDNKMREVLKNE